MSRSGYSDDIDNWALIKWRGQVKSATRGARGQAMLRELLDALDAMPEKRLVANELEAEGQFCTLGVLGAKRGLELGKLDPEDNSTIANTFGIARALACEIMFKNDCDFGWSPTPETPEHRWSRMRTWVAAQIAAEVLT